MAEPTPQRFYVLPQEDGSVETNDPMGLIRKLVTVEVLRRVRAVAYGGAVLTLLTTIEGDEPIDDEIRKIARGLLDGLFDQKPEEEGGGC